MFTKIHSSNKLLHFSALAVAFILIFSAVIVTRAQTIEVDEKKIDELSITFPIAELGNCGSKEECKKYCDDSNHIDACIDFASKNGLISEKEKKNVETFKTVIGAGGGPGQCKSKDECERYCSSLTHIKECVNFAEKHGLIEKREIEEAKKITSVIENGERMPGNCTSREECERYCEASEHEEECFTFAERAGLIEGEELSRIKKFRELQMEGKTPGQCKGKEECERYCHVEENRKECFDFMVREGLVSEEDKEKFEKTGGKGPGNCSSKEECERFCNAKENQEMCIAFAKEHGFVKREDAEKMKEGLSRMRMGLERAPEEVKHCLNETLGDGILAKIEDGTFTPKEDLSHKINNCFEKHKDKFKGSFGRPIEDNPEMRVCLENAVGQDVLKKIREGGAPPDLETAEKMKTCFQGGEFSGGERMMRQESNGEGERESQNEMMRVCLTTKLGGEIAGKYLAQEQIENKDEARAAIQECEREFQKNRIRLEDGNKGQYEMGKRMIQEMRECIVGKAGEEAVKNFEEGLLPQPGGPMENAMRECAMERGDRAGERPQNMPPSGMMPREGDREMPREGGEEMYRPPEGRFEVPQDAIFQKCKTEVFGNEMPTEEGAAMELRAKMEECVRNAHLENAALRLGSAVYNAARNIMWLFTPNKF